MRILIASTIEYIAFHGQAIFTINLAEGLAKNGHTVMALVGSDRGHAYQSERNGVCIQAVDALDLGHFHPDSSLPLFSARAVRNVFETFQPDIVHIQDHYFLCRNAAITAHRLGVKCVGTNHFMPENLAPYVPVFSRIKPVFNWVLWHWMRETYDRLDAVAGPSRTLPISSFGWGATAGLPHLVRSGIPAISSVPIRRWTVQPGGPVTGSTRTKKSSSFLLAGWIGKSIWMCCCDALRQLDRPDIQVVLPEKAQSKTICRPWPNNWNWAQRYISPGLSPRKTCHAILNSIDIFAMPE